MGDATVVCPTSNLPSVACAHCRQLATEHDSRGMSRRFTVRFASECAGCSFDIRPGDTARFVDGRNHHEGCADG